MQTAHKREPIAIVGIGCRYPGAPDKDAFWELLRAGRCTVTEVPPDRFDLKDYYDPDGLTPGTTACRHGGFLDDIHAFDASFFGIGKKEATAMDVQQRILLELAREALEDGGLTRESLNGAVAGVFIGASASDHGEAQLGEQGRPHMSAYTLAGAAVAMIANRLSHALDLRGPSLNVNTACSSSGVAIHLACASLWSGECDVALAGGVNAILRPVVTLAASSTGMLSSEGKCRSFDARADGFVRSEGAGLVVLKPLSRALADGDPIYAVIRGSGTGHSGGRSELTSLSGEAQAELALSVCKRAGVSPHRLDYVEAQGTATVIGDPIEAAAIGSVAGPASQRREACWVGSVKTNIGHTEAAGSVAGLIKTALALHHEEIPPHLHFEVPNPRIAFEELGLRVPTRAVPWPRRSEAPRVAGVNAYAVGGTSAYLLLEGAEAIPSRRAPGPSPLVSVRHGGWYLVPLSARSDAALRAQRTRLARFVEESGLDVSQLANLCHTLGVRRDHHAFRWAAIVDSVEALHLALSAGTERERDPAALVAFEVRLAADPSADRLLRARAEYIGGGAPSWRKLYPAGEHLHLPAYAWQRKRFVGPWSLAKSGAAVATPSTRALATEAPASAPGRTAPLPTLARSQEAAGLDRRAVEREVERLVREALGLDPATSLDRDQGLFDLGLTSLGAVDLAGSLARWSGRRVLPADLFRHNTTARLTTLLLQPELSFASPTVPVASALARVAPVESHQAYREPIAVVGMDCRFPGGVTDPESFWRLLREGRDAIGPIPPARWDVERYYSSEPAPGKIYVREGGFLDDLDLFDADLFGISPREAEQMDPQHRLLLELSWAALERSGIAPSKLRNSSTGVFVATGSRDYAALMGLETVPEQVDPHACLGNWGCIAAGRIAFVLGLQGPVMHVDTACSSSLLAVHLAVQSLRAGECNRALAGGASLILSPLNMMSRCAFRAVAADGRCRTFDAGASGYGQSEGAGIVVLRRLADALRDGDPILAVIRGSAVNHDGPASGLTVPNGEAQEALIRAALHNGGVAPGEVAYVEAHGTGTTLGDPIEVSALARAFGLERTTRVPLIVGSVKTNMGHAEAAAGIAGFIKTVLAVQHGEIPAHLHFDTPNPHIPWHDLALEVPKATRSWPEGPRVGGVSSFGMSGTNVHVLVGAAPPVAERGDVESYGVHTLLLSAKTEGALQQLAGSHAEHLRSHPELDLGDVCFTAAVARGVAGTRAAVVASERADLVAGLDDLASGRQARRVLRPRSPSPRRPLATAFLFTGQGAQYPGMGRGLYRSEPVFRDAIDGQAKLFDALLDRPLLSVLFPADGDDIALHDTTYTQPALFAVGLALATLWRSWGIEPDVLIGHSIGELTAACLAGVFSLEDAVKLVAARGLLMGALPRGGGMASLRADLDRVERLLVPHIGSLSVAAENGPDQIVVSGESRALDFLLAEAKSQGIESTRLQVSHAFHSPLMDPALDAFEVVAGLITYRVPVRRLVSNLTGRLATDEVCRPRYWVDHLRHSVRFASGMATVAQLGVTACIELGPHPTLVAMGARCLPDSDMLWLPSLRRGHDEERVIATGLATLWTGNAQVDCEAYYRSGRRRRVAMPTYPFQRRRYWVEPIDVALRDRTNGEGPQGQSDDCFEVVWRPSSIPVAPPKVGGAWFLVGHEDELTQKLRQTLERHGATVEVASPASALDALRARLSRPGGILGVAQLCGVQAAPRGALSALAVVEALDTGTLLALELSRELSGRDLRDLPRLHIVTRGVWAVHGEEVTSAVQAPIWGLGRAIAAQWPSLRCVRVDLAPAPADSEVEQLAAALLLDDVEDEIALRNGQRHVARLVRSTGGAAHGSPARKIAPDAVYLIAGDPTGLGLFYARWLAAHGARKLIVVDPRREVSPPSGGDCMELRKISIAVDIVSADLTSAEGLSRVQAIAAEIGSGLRGVIYALDLAGDEVPVTAIQRHALHATLSATIHGACNLHEATARAPLDFFVLHASAQGVLGRPEQPCRAAIGAFLDALAYQRRSAGLPATVLDWGSIEAPFGGLDTSVSGGMGVFTEEEAAAGFTHAFIADRVHLSPMKLDPRQWQELYPSTCARPFFSDLGSAAKPGSLIPTATGSRSPDSQSDLLRNLSARAPHLSVEQTVTEQIAGVLRRVDVPADVPLTELGMDSLLGIELRNALEKRFDTSLPPSLIWTYPTRRALVEHLTSKLTPPPLERVQEPERPALRQPRAAPGDAIAIVGMGCRYPGGIRDAASYWKALCDGLDAVRETTERWPGAPAELLAGGARWAALLDEDIATFDAAFFGISPREAEQMDPQQRLVLEVVWEALEDAGVVVEGLRGSKTAVFIGASGNEYKEIVTASAHGLDSYAGTGSALSILSGRVSYALGLQGPAMTLDTACSSALVAVHLACASLQRGESDLSLAGGVNLLLSPMTSQLMAKMQALSPDGHCRTFDAMANGYVRGEGCGVVVLKRLADAERDGDAVWAVVRGSAVNQDGRSTGLTAPNELAQRAMLQAALDSAGLQPDDIGYVEAHGTGTPLGDPIEMEALKAVLGRRTPEAQPLFVGSVKGNIGHLEAAAGVAGLMKAVLVLRHGEIPGQMNHRARNPRIALDGSNIHIPRERTLWPAGSAPRFAGVSAFGLSGTNAHVVLGEGKRASSTGVEPQRSLLPSVLLLSARSRDALSAAATRMREWLGRCPDVRLEDAAYSTSVRRDHHRFRLAIVAHDRSEALERLTAFTSGSTGEDVVSAHAPVVLPQLRFVFSGEAETGSADADQARDEGGVGAWDSMPSGQETPLTVKQALCALHCKGVHVDWARYHGPDCKLVDLPHYPWQKRRYWVQAPPPYAPVVPQPASPAQSGARPASTSEMSLVARLQSAPADERRPSILEHVAAAARRVLRLPHEEPLMAAADLFDLGLDSLTSAELSTILEADLGMDLGAGLIQKCPTVDAISLAVEGRLGAKRMADRTDESRRAPAPPAVSAKDERSGRWLVRARLRPEAKLRLICHPYAAGGANLFGCGSHGTRSFGLI